MIMNKKLRLLVTTKCPNRCPMCCNNSWDFDKLPVVERWDYDEIMITGGEPLLHYIEVIHLVQNIKEICKIMGYKIPKFYVYTALFESWAINKTIDVVDGIVLTPHSKKDVELFVIFNSILLYQESYSFYKTKSLRLNLFPNIKKLLPKDIDLSMWKVKDIEWIKDCPVPEGEDFRRIAKLW